MSTIVVEIYEAFIDAGVDETKAKLAAKSILSKSSSDDLATKIDIVELKSEMIEMKLELIKWTLGFLLAQTGIIIAALKLF
jgi:hypothetical protein